MSFLGIDVDTSGVKAMLLDAEGRALADASAPLTVSRPRPGFSEQTPDDWWTAVLEAVDGLAHRHRRQMAALKGVGLSGQMHGATLLDANDAVIRPAILWNDVRSANECREMEESLPSLRRIAGNIAMPGFTAPKVLWVRKHEPDTHARIAKVLLPKDYVRLHLTGAYASDMSDAAGTLWLDVAKRDWSDELLAATGLTRNAMPSLVEGSEVSGRLKRSLCERWGVRTPPVVAGGGGDNAASACGIGAIEPGAGFVSLGTSGVLFVSNETFRPNTEGAVHAFCHAIPGTWHQMGVFLSATDSLNWLAKLVNRKPAELAGMVTEGFNGPGEEIFLPYLSGERTPHNNAKARGSFVGLSHLSDARTMARTVMEGVAFAVRDCHRVLSDAGTTIASLIAVGGGSKSELWLEMIATTLGMAVEVPEDGDFGGAFGAARLGMIAATGAAPESVCTKPKIVKTIEPRADLTAAYDDQYERYRALYPAIEETSRND
ncbi:xylulokinase [Roseospira visakhapatnamensis]|uniref:Xylulose kinase n=1 Tax=Roseospira visakhapatnamensis TaxID=390880 RepID=A0A7W6RH63_9PROT|nr:xylulokinase [Roseospira visakhapatnamensis]MBB4267959.1 xylulokinase [Roseospira visakhapatnamensis]